MTQRHCHLESVKVRRDQSVTSKEDMEERMRQAKERINKLRNKIKVAYEELATDYEVKNINVR